MILTIVRKDKDIKEAAFNVIAINVKNSDRAYSVESSAGIEELQRKTVVKALEKYFGCQIDVSKYCQWHNFNVGEKSYVAIENWWGLSSDRYYLSMSDFAMNYDGKFAKGSRLYVCQSSCYESNVLSCMYYWGENVREVGYYNSRLFEIKVGDLTGTYIEKEINKEQVIEYDFDELGVLEEKL